MKDGKDKDAQKGYHPLLFYKPGLLHSFILRDAVFGAFAEVMMEIPVKHYSRKRLFPYYGSVQC